MTDFLEEKEKRNSRNFFIKVSALFILLFIVFIFNMVEMSRRDFVDIGFLDVGQGDGALIEIHNTNHNPIRVMIDTGRSSRTLISLDRFYSRDMINYLTNLILKPDIDTLILTHNDDDHIGMRCEIISKYHVQHVLISSSMNENQITKCNTSLTPNPSPTIDSVYSGDEINFRNVNFKILNPSRNQKSDDNDLGIVTLVTVNSVEDVNQKEKRILFIADINQYREQSLINIDAGQPQSSLRAIDILKVAHHGSDGSSGENFIKYTSPEISIISVGKNNYGHPSPRVIDLLTHSSSTVRRTDKEGNIILQIKSGP